MKIKNLVFDLGGVIVPLNRVACIRAFNDIVGYKDFGEVLRTYRQIGFFEKFETGQISARQFRQIIRTHSAIIRDGKPKIVSDREIDYSLNCFLSDIPQDKIETLLFYRKDYRMLLLSNTNPIGMAYCRKLFKDKGYDVKELFEKLYLSYRMRLAKPDKAIFIKMIEDSGIVPEETLYIDDSPANIEAGRALGLHTVLYNPKEDLYGKISEYALVVDAGIGFRTIKQRLAKAGVDVSSVEMIFVTHDHVDHVRGLLSLAQRLSVPVYATARLHDALSRHNAVGPDLAGSRRVLRLGVTERIRGVDCVAFEVPHDATQTLGYFLDFFGVRFVFMTDLGRVPEYAYAYCQQADYVIIESNYDIDMLIRGRYTPDLKARVMSDRGHLSNDDCASTLKRIWHPGLKGIFLCHLSQDNNTPGLAYRTSYYALKSIGLSVPEDLQLVCLPRSDIFSLDF